MTYRYMGAVTSHPIPQLLYPTIRGAILHTIQMQAYQTLCNHPIC